MKKLNDKVVKSLQKLGVSDFSSDSDSNSSGNSTESKKDTGNSDSDTSTSHSHTTKSKKRTKKIRSGIKDKPHDKVKLKLSWPQSALKYEYTSRTPIPFNKLNVFQFAAGELEIIRKSNISDIERNGRLSLLNKIFYYAADFEWAVILDFYAAWLKMIETGEKKWNDDTTMLEVRMLVGQKSGVKRKTQKYSTATAGYDRNDDSIWFCSLYQRNKCSYKESTHKMEIRGKERTVHHICASCYRKDKNRFKHPECSSACPHQD